MKELRAHSYLKCELDLAAPVKKSMLALEGISNISSHGRKVTFVYTGDPNKLTKLLAGVRLTDISIEEPALEEVFMQYYKKEG